MPQAPKKSFRFQGKKVFLTFPQCDTVPEDILKNILLKFADDELVAVWVAQEEHKDGNKHIHCIIIFRNRLRTRNTHFFDSIGGKHPNIESIRNLCKCVKYLKKEGPCIEWGDVAVAKASSVTFKSLILELNNGVGLRDLNEDYGNVIARHLSKLRDYVGWLTEGKNTNILKKWIPLPEESDPSWSMAALRVKDWLKGMPKALPFGGKHLYLWGKTGVGKTSLPMWLAQHFNVYWMPTDELFYDMWEPNKYDLVVIDEFKSQKTITWMNQFLGGAHMSMRIKGGQSYKSRNIRVIILSNYSFEDIYRNVSLAKKDTLRRRLEIVHVEGFLEFVPDPNDLLCSENEEDEEFELLDLTGDELSVLAQLPVSDWELSE